MRSKWDASYWTNCFALALFFNAVGGNNQILTVGDWVEEVRDHFSFPSAGASKKAVGISKGLTNW